MPDSGAPLGWLALAAALVTPWSFVPSSGADDEPSPGTDLYLVTLRSPGTSGYAGSPAGAATTARRC